MSVPQRRAAAALALALLCVPLSVRADAVSDAAATARQVKAYADAATAQIAIAQTALQQTRAATAQARTAMGKALAASSDADQAKAKAVAAKTAAEAEAAAAAKARADAEAAAAAGDCAAAKAAAAAAASAAAAADKAADAAAASLPAVQKDAATADQAKTDALAAAHRAHDAAAGAVAAYAAADKAALAASNALEAAFGKAPTMSDVGKDTSDGSVKVTDTNQSLFQDAVFAAMEANSSASDVNQIRQNAVVSYGEADQDTQNAFNAARHIQADAGAVIDAKNAAARAARKAADDAAAAKAAADACKPKLEPPKTPPPPPPPPPKPEPRTYPIYSHRGTCEPCHAAEQALNDAVDAYNALPPGPNGTANPAKDAALAKVHDLADALSVCERKCVAPSAQDQSRSAPQGNVPPPASPQQRRTASVFETAVFNEINRARTDPAHYVLISDRYPPGPVEVGRSFLRNAMPIAPLEWGDGIAVAASVQAADQGPKGQDNHVGSDGSTPMARMQKAGVWSMREDEVISVGENTPASVVAQLIIDPPDTLHLHRSVLFDAMMKFVGVACGPNTKFGVMCVIDTAGAPVPRD